MDGPPNTLFLKLAGTHVPKQKGRGYSDKGPCALLGFKFSQMRAHVGYSVCPQSFDLPTSVGDYHHPFIFVKDQNNSKQCH